MSAETTWTEHEVAMLRQLWPAGEPASVIGAKIGRSGGAVTKKAKKLGMQSRIHYSADGRNVGGRPSGIPSSASDGMRALRLAMQLGLKRQVPVASRVQAPPSLPIPSPRFCQFIEGDVKPQPQFCGCATVPGKSWCRTHLRRVFVRHVQQEAA